MKKKIQLLHRQMLTDLERSWHSELTDDVEKIEKCFRIAIKGWCRLRDEFGYNLANTEDEIDFFKNLKPLFTGRVEFYTIAYKSLLFQPEDKARLKNFWKNEMKRLNIFRKKNEKFIKYYKSGDTSLDHQYFLKTEDDQDLNSQEVGSELRSSHDHLVAAMHAQELYHDFVIEQLKNL